MNEGEAEKILDAVGSHNFVNYPTHNWLGELLNTTVMCYNNSGGKSLTQRLTREEALQRSGITIQQADTGHFGFHIPNDPETIKKYIALLEEKIKSAEKTGGDL